MHHEGQPPKTARHSAGVVALLVYLTHRKMVRILSATLSLLLIALTATAQRVVSLLPSATYTAAQIGADSNIIGRTSYCPKPLPGTQSATVGDAMTVSLESIIALRPDVVIASPFTPQTVTSKLKSLKIRVVDIATAKDLNELDKQTEEIGSLTNHRQEALANVRTEHAKVDSLANATTWTRGKKVYIQIGTHPLWGATPDYYINDLTTRLGMTNVLAANEGPCSREAVLQRKPDVIIVSSMGGLGKEEAAEWAKLIKATVIVVDETTLCCPTPTFFRKTMEQICKESQRK